MIGLLNPFLRSRRALFYLVLIWETLISWVIYTSPAHNWVTSFGLWAMGFVVFAFQLHTRWGSPKYWWAEIMGTSISFERSFRQSGLDFQTFEDQMNDWLQTTKPGLYVQQPGYSMLFLRKKNAALFKLAWG